MESKDPLQAVQSALAEEGHPEVGVDFALSEVDRLTKWVGAHAIEEALGVSIPDEQIESAATVGELVALAQEGKSVTTVLAHTV
ncbi:MAG: hypothetical protein ACTHW1_05785 [Ancrocorticia sp.]|uniref:hypothetical protein n=1 Tax=Ancrocorticia sp. TaxID=2593684 RepID=UPI003F90CC98